MAQAQSRRAKNKTSFGNPERILSPRFYALGRLWLKSINRIIFFAILVLSITFIGQLMYLGIGKKLSNLFLSDGTIFSCEVDEREQRSQK